MSGCYWLYNRERPDPGWPERLRSWVVKHGNIPTAIWMQIDEDRDEIVRAMYDDCVEHGFSAREFVHMAELRMGDIVRLASLDEALAAVADAPRWRLSFGRTDFGSRVIEHMVPRRPHPDDFVPCTLSFEGGLRPISRYEHDDVVLHDLCRFRIGLSGQGTTIDEPLLLQNLKSTPGFAEWKHHAEELLGPLHEYLFYYGL